MKANLYVSKRKKDRWIEWAEETFGAIVSLDVEYIIIPRKLLEAYRDKTDWEGISAFFGISDEDFDFFVKEIGKLAAQNGLPAYQENNKGS